MQQPSVVVHVHIASPIEMQTETLQRFDDTLHEVFPNANRSETLDLISSVETRTHPVLGRVLGLSLEILSKMGMPIMSGAKAFLTQPTQDQGHTNSWQVALPAISREIPAPLRAIAFSCGLMNQLARESKVSTNMVNSELEKLLAQFRALAPAGVNTLRFLQAAHEMGIPWLHVAKNIYQFGWGKKSRWLDSSFTDQTSQIGAALARDKVACAKVLREAGLPVPRHQLVGNVEQAVKVAQALGYPVVVKPADLDGGLGVSAGVRDEKGVRKAFVTAGKLSRRVLVEQYIDGSDYRIRVFDGEVTAVVARRPASVIGDGILTVQSLIDRANSERAEKKGLSDPEFEQGTKPIVIDDEVHQWLEYQGLNLHSIVASGIRVRLRGAANVSVGGTTWEVTQQAHIDNLKLALDAVSALRLDIAGVDVLLPDIAATWRETGGAICEVNAQPQFSTGRAYRQFLERLVPNGGRIPVVLVTGDTDKLALQSELRQLLGVRAEGVRLVSSIQECHAALVDTKTLAVVFMSSNMPSEDWSLPFDRADLCLDANEIKNLATPLADLLRLSEESTGPAR